MQKIKVMLPSYNEALSLPSLLNKIENTKVENNTELHVLIANDGSSDETLEISKNFSSSRNWVRVLDMQPNKGLASVMREGLLDATRDMDDDDILITLDADDSHDPSLIPQMVKQINQNNDIVIASRYRKGSKIVGLASHRKLLSLSAALLFKILKPIPGVLDYTCGYRAYRVSIIRKGYAHYKDKFIVQQGFGCMAEILLKLRIFKPAICELPFILRYDQKQSDSKMKIIKTVFQTLTLVMN